MKTRTRFSFKLLSDTGSCGDEVKAIEDESVLIQLCFGSLILRPRIRIHKTQNLYATLQVFKKWSSGTEPISVAKIFGVRPTVNSSTKLMGSDSLELTIEGRGFDATYPTNNVVSFDGDNVQGYFVNSTLTRLILQFSSLAPSDEGALLLL